MEKALQSLIERFGKDDRIYSVSFNDAGEWAIKVTDTDGKWFGTLAQMTAAEERFFASPAFNSRRRELRRA
jgi:hypothetical protein